jgi:hypothetical protein
MIRQPLGQRWLVPALLLEAAKSLAPLSTELSRRALLASFCALLSAYQCAEGTTGGEIGEVALSALEGVDSESTVDSLLRGMASSFVCDYREAASALRRSLATFEQMSAEEMTEWYYVGPFMTNELWDPDAYKIVVDLLETAARQQGSILALQPALLAPAAEEIREGRFSTARTRFSELLDITEAIGGFTSFSALLDVELVAWEGEEDAARAKIHDLIKGSTALGIGAGVQLGHYALAILELGLGRYPEALTAARTLGATRAPGGWCCYALPLIVEAAIRCADVTTANEVLGQIEERAQVVQTPFALGLMCRCRALVMDDDRTVSSFRSAIEWLGKSLWHTELARTHLCVANGFGERGGEPMHEWNCGRPTTCSSQWEQRRSQNAPEWNSRPPESGPEGGEWIQLRISRCENFRSPGLLRTAVPAERSPPSCSSARIPSNTISRRSFRSSE